jgi:hypothetical protein
MGRATTFDTKLVSNEKAPVKPNRKGDIQEWVDLHEPAALQLHIEREKGRVLTHNHFNFGKAMSETTSQNTIVLFSFWGFHIS